MFGLTDAVGRAALRAASYAAVCLLTVCTGTAIARAETRSLKIYHLHTHEKEDIAYKRNGRYLPEGLKKINWILRDWRKAQPINMDPRLLDLIWEAYRQSGSNAYINVVCGYRSPATNGMLRSRTAGVAKESQHMLGRAMDFYLPDVSLAKLRAIGLKMQIGGVGYYPKSGSPFVHFDVGNVRHWPGMSRRELLAVFPNGNTVHLPSDGKPLPGYEQALASYKSRKSSNSIQVANAGASPASSDGGGKTLFAMLFGGGADEEEDAADAEDTRFAPAKAARTEAAKPAREPAPAEVVARPARQEAVAVAAMVPTPKREVLPGGVPLPIRDTFDTTAPKTMVPPAGLTGETKPETIEVAALDLSRIPLPSAAPVRESSLVAEAMKVPVPSQPADAPHQGGEALLAALETSPDADEIAANEAGQLAYSIPTPRIRPPFASILKREMPSAGTIDEVRAITETANAQTPVAKALQASAAPIPTMDGRPSLPAERHPAAKVVIASLEAHPKPAPAFAAAAKPVAVPAGKTARFQRRAFDTQTTMAVAASSAPRISQQAIGDRIRMADLAVADLGQRADMKRTGRPNADRLVRKAPGSVPATGFTSERAAGFPDGFAGSAADVTPTVKAD